MHFAISDRGVATAAEPLIGLAKITRLALNGVGFAPLKSEMIARLQNNEADAAAWLDLSTILQIQGDRANRYALQSNAMDRARHFTHMKIIPGAEPLRLLALMAPGDFMANTPLEFLLEGSSVALESFYLSAQDSLPSSLPDHDLAFVAVAESDENRPILERLAGSSANWPRPLINDPGLIAGLTRDGFAKLMQGAHGVVVPPVQRIDRDDLGVSDQSADFARFDYPIIARPVGSHAGEGLNKIDGASDLERYLNEVECDHYYVAPFVDYSNADGLFRKFRIVLIEGEPFAVHMAISHHWMVHYLNADMTNNEANRHEEAAFMEAFETDFALRHAEAFRAVHQRTGLDYVLLDCAETSTGDLLIFEAGTAMIVHSLDPVDIFPYKPRNMEKIFVAFESMLRRKADSIPGFLKSSRSSLAAAAEPQNRTAS
jgi:hypothetical protein